MKHLPALVKASRIAAKRACGERPSPYSMESVANALGFAKQQLCCLEQGYWTDREKDHVSPMAPIVLAVLRNPGAVSPELSRAAAFEAWGRDALGDMWDSFMWDSFVDSMEKIQDRLDKSESME